MAEQCEQMQRWLRVIERIRDDARGGVVLERCSLDLWRLSGVRQVNATWLEFVMEVDEQNMRAEQLWELGRGTMVIRANVREMPAVKDCADEVRARQDFLAMALFFLAKEAVDKEPDAHVGGVPAYVWPTWTESGSRAAG